MHWHAYSFNVALEKAICDSGIVVADTILRKSSQLLAYAYDKSNCEENYNRDNGVTKLTNDMALTYDHVISPDFQQPEMDCCFPDVTSETMDIWWAHLKQLNKNSIITRAKLKMPFFAASQKMTTLICNIGHNMELSREILLSSVLLFDRFMCFSYNKMSEEKSNVKKEQWMETLQNSMILTICSCLQLSSKALGQHQVQVTDILKFMLEHNHPVTKTEVVKSEGNVFKTLKYKVPAFSPIIFVETLVHLLPVKKLNLACSVFMETCAQFMMIAYCHHQVLYDSLYYVFTSKESCLYKDRVEFLRVELDQLYLAGAVVVAAARVLAPGERTTSGWLLHRVRLLTGIPTREVMRLAAVLSDIAADIPEVPSATTRTH